jgi:hypothetical protein
MMGPEFVGRAWRKWFTYKKKFSWVDMRRNFLIVAGSLFGITESEAC